VGGYLAVGGGGLVGMAGEPRAPEVGAGADACQSTFREDGGAMSVIHIPSQVEKAMGNLRSETRAKLSLRDIDAFVSCILAVEVELAEARAEIQFTRNSRAEHQKENVELKAKLRRLRAGE